MHRTMLLKPGSGPFIFLLGLLSTLSPVSVDMFVLTMPTLVSVFATDVATVQHTMTAYFVGTALGQLLYGPISDRFGRRPPLLAGLAIYAAAAVVCAFAGSIEVLIAGRFLQALGLSAGSVLAYSIARDLYTEKQAARVLSLMWIVMSGSPILSPIIGAGLLEAADWRAVFWAMALIGAALFAWVGAGLTETAPRGSAAASGPLEVARSFRFLLGQRRYLAYMLMVISGQILITTFVATSAFVVVRALGYSERAYAAAYVAVALGHLAGSFAGSRLVTRHGIDRMIAIGTLVTFVSGAALVALAWLRVDHIAAIVAPCVLMFVGATLVTPPATAAALSPFPAIAGAASSLLGVLQLAGATVVSLALGASYDGTQRPMASAMGLLALAMLLIHFLLIRTLPKAAER